MDIQIIKKLYNGQETILNLHNGYTRIVSEHKYNSIYGEGLKILTPKQTLRRLPKLL